MAHTKQCAPARAHASSNREQIIAQPKRQSNSLSPRLVRLARALLGGPRTVRELVDIVPSNNPAEYVRQLREEHGLAIFCEHVAFTTVDGESSWYGKYHLTQEDREKLREMIGGQA